MGQSVNHNFQLLHKTAKLTIRSAVYMEIVRMLSEDNLDIRRSTSHGKESAILINININTKRDAFILRGSHPAGQKCSFLTLFIAVL